MSADQQRIRLRPHLATQPDNRRSGRLREPSIWRGLGAGGAALDGDSDETFGRGGSKARLPVVTRGDERAKCSCYYVSEHIGPDADRYATEHLKHVRSHPFEWGLDEYQCPLYGKRWLRDEPWGTGHGGGPYRLRTFEQVCRDIRGELRKVTMLLGDDDEAAAAAAVIRSRLGDCSGY